MDVELAIRETKGERTPDGCHYSWPMIARTLANEIEDMRRVITEYVNEVESGQKFDALCLLVPGLASDDGAYGAVDPDHAVVAEWRAAKGVGA
jgi:hypothetical protein